MYAHLPKNKSLLKVEIMFFLTAFVLLAQKLQGPQVLMQDEPGKRGELVISFAGGDKEILEKEKSMTVWAVPTNPVLQEEEVVLPHLPAIEVKEEEAKPENVAVSVPIFFSPATYPELLRLIGVKYNMEDLLDIDYLRENLYIVNATTKMTEQEFDAAYFLKKDITIKKKEEPQILIYHTHGSEAFSDSRPGVEEDSVIGMGDLLAAYLEEKYGLSVIHDKTVFDVKDGKDNRNNAYNDALVYIEQFLSEHPSIEVMIDLHRDAGTKRVTTIQGKKVAKVMLFNGLCRNTQGKLTYLPNEYLKDNLAFSFQMKLIGDEMYPGLMNRIFLKDYRYNMHLRERTLLIELGTNENTVEEARNAMEPLADVLAYTLGVNEK